VTTRDALGPAGGSADVAETGRATSEARGSAWARQRNRRRIVSKLNTTFNACFSRSKIASRARRFGGVAVEGSARDLFPGKLHRRNRECGGVVTIFRREAE